MGERALPPSWNGSVMLDIGGDVGALLLRTPSSWVGREIDLNPDDPAVPHVHSSVRARWALDEVTYAAVYPHLLEGQYTIGGTTRRVAIEGGRVAHVDIDDQP